MTVLRVFICFSSICIAVILATTIRPSRPLVGAFSDVDNVNDESIQEAVNVGAEHLAAKPDYPCREAYSVTRVRQQVVSGIKYRITFRANPSACGENGENGGLVKICTVDVHVQSWLNSRTASKARCRDE